MPYAAGFLVVKPDEDVGAKPDYSIETYFSDIFFIRRSIKILFDFRQRIAAVLALEKDIRTV
jgi:hypothetical protein